MACRKNKAIALLSNLLEDSTVQDIIWSWFQVKALTPFEVVPSLLGSGLRKGLLSAQGGPLSGSVLTQMDSNGEWKAREKEREEEKE